MCCPLLSAMPLVAALAAILLLPLATMANFTPAFPRDHVNAFPAAAASPKGIALDGDLADWRDEAFVTLYPDLQRRDEYVLRLAFAYDQAGLLVAGRMTGKLPLVNHNNPRTDAHRCWDGTALQWRMVTDSRLTKPFPGPRLQDNAVTHLTLWRCTETGEAAVDARYGMNFHSPRTLFGADAPLVFGTDKQAPHVLTFEGRMPWSLLNAKAAEPGAAWLATLQVLFAGANGRHGFDFFECIVPGAGRTYEGPDGWGSLYFVPADEAPQRMAQQAQFAEQRLAKEKGGYEALLADAAQRIGDHVDWSRPELKDSPIEKAHRAGEHVKSATMLIRHLRARATPVLEYSRQDIERIRAAAKPEERQAQRKKFQAAGGGIEQYAFATREDFAAAARKVMEKRNDWGLGGWGTTRGITREISKAWPIEECPDEALIPYLAWLVSQAPAEWTAARAWDEALLGVNGHNWWAVTFRGFYQAGLYFPEFKGFSRWRALAPTWMEREAMLLFAPDGFSRERSGYHGVAADLWAGAAVARKNGVVFSDAFDERLRRAQAASDALLTPDGQLPAIGDGFIGYASSGEPNLPALRAAADRFAKLPTTDTVLPDSGYYMVRQNWTAQADYALIDAGARGNGVTSHDMASLFHVQLHARGRCILTCNGAGPYDGSPARMWRRGAASHGCPTVDGQEPIPFTGTHGFDAVVLPTIDAWINRPDYAYFSGVHEGYARRGIAVPAVRRKLFYLRGGYWILIDRFTSGSGNAEHTYRTHFQIPAGLAQLGDDGRVSTRGAGGNLLIIPVKGARGEPALSPCPHPLKGYHNPDQLTYTLKAVGHGLMAFVLVPFSDDLAPKAAVKLLDVKMDDRTVSPWEATGLEIEIDGRRDVYVDQHMHWNLSWEAGGQRGEGRLFHSRCK